MYVSPLSLSFCHLLTRRRKEKAKGSSSLSLFVFHHPLTFQCNREFPCQHCLARKVPELCVGLTFLNSSRGSSQVPYNPQSSSSSTGPDSRTANRLDLIESVLSVVVRHTTGITSYEAVKEWMSSKISLQFSPGPLLTPSTSVSADRLRIELGGVVAEVLRKANSGPQLASVIPWPRNTTARAAAA